MNQQKKDVPWGTIIQAVVSIVTAFINRPRKASPPPAAPPITQP